MKNTTVACAAHGWIIFERRELQRDLGGGGGAVCRVAVAVAAMTNTLPHLAS